MNRAPGVLRSSLRLMLLADVAPDGPLPVEAVVAALRGGVTAVQLRAKGAAAAAVLGWARDLLPRCRAAGVPLLVNDRPDLALAAGADGVHVGPRDLPPGAARRVLGPEPILGVSARDPERVAAAEGAGADYLGVGALRATRSKPEAPPLGPAGIEALLRRTRLPVVAVGGVLPADAPALRRIGAAGMAVLGGILGTGDPEAAARAYREAWERG